MKRLLAILLLIPLLLSAQEGRWINGNFSGLLKANRQELRNTYHVFGGFQDSAVTVTLDSVNVWRKVTNAGNNLWQSDEYDGFTMYQDAMVVAHKGDYSGAVSVTIDGGNTKDFQARVYNVTQDREEGYHLGETTTGTNNFANFDIPIYLRVNAGDTLEFQVRCTTDASSPRFRSAIF